VGVAMTFSFGKLRERGATRRSLVVKAVKRGAILFGLGLLMHSFPWIGYDYSQLRIPGVLQRIGLAYVVASLIFLWTGPRGRLAALAVLLFGYWALMSWVPVPGEGAGILEPGRDLGAFIDRAVFGTDHLWAQSRTWDPEGLLGTLPAVGTVLTGVFAGDWLRRGRAEGWSPGKVVGGLFAAGAVAVTVGLLWDLAFPINKPLWTSSYVVFTAGMAALSLGVCYWLVDARGYRRWSRPFLFFGVNAIAAYFLSGLFARALDLIRVPIGDGATLPLKTWIHQHAFASWLAPINASLAFAIAFVLVWTVIVWALYRKRIFIKV
jgi:predicted acyltransferase